jgi:hypothetical protein
MNILLGGLVWIAFSILAARPGFYNYCVMRAIGEKRISADDVYETAKPKLLSTAWFASSFLTAVLLAIGLSLLNESEDLGWLQVLGLGAVLTAMGIQVGFLILRSNRIWLDAVRQAK